MSRQNKQLRQRALAAEVTALHKQGQRGPKRTTHKHNKKNVQPGGARTWVSTRITPNSPT
jgi:hypothetical protein